MLRTRSIIILMAVALVSQSKAQNNPSLPDSNQQQYQAALKVAGKQFTQYLYPNYTTLYSLPEKTFVSVIDSVRNVFTTVLNKYQKQLPGQYREEQSIEIKYYFDKLLIDYPINHDIFIGNTAAAPSKIAERLQANFPDFNKPALLANSDFRDYLKAFLEFQVTIERRKATYRNDDNQHLSIIWKMIPRFISNTQCREFWQCDYLYNHIDNNGIKDLETIYNSFTSTCKDTAYLNKVKAIYTEDADGRRDHLIKTYKTVGPFHLDMHLFLPDSTTNSNKHPLIVYFHGGSWSEGKPDWFFYACSTYAKKGWVACAVEYRTYGRHGTLPFDAVMDARSAIRWLRQHADEYNIDTNRIVASGNSAGGHLVLCTALANNWNEKTDNLQFSPVPNALMVNSGVYDLTDQSTAWIRKDLKDKSIVKEISPCYLVKKDLPPTLIIHGTNDRNVPYASAEMFVTQMGKAGNNTIEFHPLKGATHYIWLDPQSTPEVSKYRTAFLTKLGY